MLKLERKSMIKVKGGKALEGEITASGSKNASLPILASCLMCEGQYVLSNVPNLLDIHTMLQMLSAIGLRASLSNDNKVYIENKGVLNTEVSSDLVSAMRASFFIAGPLLARTGYAKIPLPGGCKIGDRPLDIHFKGFEALGVKISITEDCVEMKTAELVGAKMRLSFPSVGATENILMAACLAKGKTVIENAAQEPEISDLCHFLNLSGAKIKGIGTKRIEIEGVRSLQGKDYEVMPDRIEVGTFMMAALMTRGDIVINRVIPDHLSLVSQVLSEAGAKLLFKENALRITAEYPLKAVNIETQPFPGFPTDMQAQIMALCCTVSGISCIRETIFENRFVHVEELKKMGADIQIEGDKAIIKGVQRLQAAQVKIPDLRAGAALFNAALAAEGESIVQDLHHLQRGYENYWLKLNQLGLNLGPLN